MDETAMEAYLNHCVEVWKQQTAGMTEQQKDDFFLKCAADVKMAAIKRKETDNA